MLKEKVIEEFWKLNPKLKPKEKDLGWRADGRLEWYCKHGVGHTVYEPNKGDYVHGCDGCCKGIKPYHKPEDGDELDDWHDEYRRVC